MFSKTRINFWLDVIIFSMFLVAAITGLLLWLVIPHGPGSQYLTFLGLTRNTWVNIHDWVGLALLIGAAVHIALHWKWVSCIAARFFRKLPRRARVNFLLDSLLFAAFFLAILSGLVVWLLLPSGGYLGGRNLFYDATLLGLTRHNWSDLHLWSGLAMMAVLAMHLALHWKWVMCVLRRYAQVTAYTWQQRNQSKECVV